MPKASKQDTLDQQKDHFNSISEDYYTYRQKPSHLMFKKLMWGYFFDRNRDAILNDKKKKLNVLEAMSGYCEGKKILEINLTNNFNYSGFDYSEEMVKIARKQFPKDNIFQQDITKFNEKDKYDLVIIIGGLHHVYNFVDIATKKVADSIKSGGYFVVFEPTNNTKFIAKVRERIYAKNDFFDDDTEHDFKLEDFNKMLTKNNLEIVDQLYPGLLAYVLFYNPDAFKSLRILNGTGLVKFLFALEKPFYAMWPGKKMSFATLTLARKK